MIKVVIFDMYETLITHYNSPLYFGAEMAKDVGILKEKFYPLWRGLDHEHTIGKLELEELLERILKENGCYSKVLLNELVVEIFERCMSDFAVMPGECLYIGDGGSRELETATALGMKAVQAVWYLQEGSTQPSKRLVNFLQAETPLEVLKYLE